MSRSHQSIFDESDNMIQTRWQANLRTVGFDLVEWWLDSLADNGRLTFSQHCRMKKEYEERINTLLQLSKFEENQRLVGDFIAEECELDPKALVNAHELRLIYEQWTHQNGLSRLSPQTFSQQMQELGFRKVRRERHGYLGLRLKQPVPVVKQEKESHKGTSKTRLVSSTSS
jgi:hypothetical protein